MTAALIAPLIPPRTRPGGREHGRPTTARRLPVAAAPEVPAVWGAGGVAASADQGGGASVVQCRDRLYAFAGHGQLLRSCRSDPWC